MNIELSSDRLNFRKITYDDYGSICKILQDMDVMYAWEHAFSEEEVSKWINKNLIRYENHGFSYFAVIEKGTNNFIGLMGPLVENIEGEEYIGIAYILAKQYWGLGYGIEGAKACMDHAFNVLKADKVIAQIRPENIQSQKVAQRLGMQVEREYLKVYDGKEVPHLIYSKTE